MGVINTDKKFIWIWVPKCAGSFIYSHPDFKQADHSIAGGHETYIELTSLIKEDVSTYFTFAFSRNPYSRIVSAFHHFKKYHNFNYYDCFEDFILDNFRGEDGSLSIQHSKTFKSTYRRRSKSGVTHDDHFKPQSFFMKNHQGAVDLNFIGKTESLPEDFNIVCRRLNITEIDNKILNATEHDSYMSYFEGPRSRAKIDVVNNIYKQDFINFDYEQI